MRRWLGHSGASSICVRMGVEGRIGAGLLKQSPFSLAALEAGGLVGPSPSRPGPNSLPAVPVQTMGARMLPLLADTLEARVTRLFTCHPLCKPISVVVVLVLCKY